MGNPQRTKRQQASNFTSDQMKPLCCPFCGSEEDIRVKDRRGIWRRRQCGYCDNRFSTREVVTSITEPKHRARCKGQLALAF